MARRTSLILTLAVVALISVSYFVLIQGEMSEASRVPVVRSSKHKWAVKLDGSTDPSQIAEELGFYNEGQVGSLANYFVFRMKEEFQFEGAEDRVINALINHPKILWNEEQIPKKRVPRETM